MDLNMIWFLLLGVLLTGYAILDGFDLGVGILHPVARSDQERRLFINSIGPLWDGNEVWLVTFGGALFAMFPEAYATIFSAFYNVFMLLLFALVFRAVSLEFRGKRDSDSWRKVWDFFFFFSSLLATVIFGAGVGNGMLGFALNERGVYTGGFFDLLGLYPVLIGLFTVALFTMHGAIYLYLKTEGQVQERLHGWLWRSWGLFLALYICITVYTLVAVPRASANFEHYPWAWIIVGLHVLVIGNIPRAIHVRKYGQAFISSSLTIAGLVFLFAFAVFPNIVPASNVAENSLTMYTAASSTLTMQIGLIIVAIGMPLVLSYTVLIYWAFRGKVKLGEHSY
ncbi:MAG: cytochrome d ubiquinol oxidase subunit II [Planctomycetes bacterium]|nr:cytochrome d ubiquinol oxidase subunit II [Planctomycetota bacterium]